MNKKEVAEIKKNFTDSSGFFTLNHIVSAYVDPQKNVRCKDNKLYALIPEDEGAVMLETLKKVLGGSVGKNLMEYAFPREEYEAHRTFCTLPLKVSLRTSLPMTSSLLG